MRAWLNNLNKSWENLELGLLFSHFKVTHVAFPTYA